MTRGAGAVSAAAQYEASLLRSRRLEEEERSGTSDRQRQQQDEGDNDAAATTAGKLLASRAETATILASAIARRSSTAASAHRNRSAGGSNNGSKGADGGANDDIGHLMALLGTTMSSNDAKAAGGMSKNNKTGSRSGGLETAVLAQMAARANRELRPKDVPSAPPRPWSRKHNDQQQQQQQRRRRAGSNARADRTASSAITPGLSADDFFGEYPECIRTDYSSSFEDDDDDDSDCDDNGAGGGNGSVEAASNIAKSPAAAPAAVAHTAGGGTINDLSQPPYNPYLYDEAAVSATNKSASASASSSYSSGAHAARGGWNDGSRTNQQLHGTTVHSTSNSSGSNGFGHPSRTTNAGDSMAYRANAGANTVGTAADPNPFRTAREFAHSSGGIKQKQPPQDDVDCDSGPTGWDDRPINSNFYDGGGRNSYGQGRYGGGGRGGDRANSLNSRDGQLHQPQNHQQQQSNTVRASSAVSSQISAGLKRKFQPPKKRTSGANVGKNTAMVSRKVCGGGGGNKRSIGGGGGTVAQPSSSGKGGSNDQDDDDELPEELKGLDKELVNKIMNEIVDFGESVTFDDIAGLADAKQAVLELVCWPMKRPDLFTGLRRGPNGLLLFGPPGTGKTLVGKAIAHESGATFFSISSSSLTSKWIGEGEKLVRTLFAVAAYREPAVVFIDEIDSLLTARKADENEASRRIKTEFLVQLDGTGTSGQGRLLCIGATNRPHELDDAARRRFVKRLYIPLPEQPDRECLLRTLLKKNVNSLTDEDITKLSAATDGYSGADLKALCNDASLGPIRDLGADAMEVAPDDVPPISYRHFRRSLKSMNPSVSKEDLDDYIKFNDTYGNKHRDDNDDDSDDSDD